MNKIFLILLLFAFLSCNSIKLKELQMDYTQDLIGKIEQIEMNSVAYSDDKKDFIVNTEKIVTFYDDKNKIIKQNETNPYFTVETDFNYKNNLLENTISKYNSRITKTEYIYDDKENVIELNELSNDTLQFKKTFKYDNKNNIIEQKKFKSNLIDIDDFTIFTYDYKNRIVYSQSFDKNNKPTNIYWKQYFNKKGYIIKSQLVHTAYSDASATIMEYDRLGNLSKRIWSNKDGKPYQSEISRNRYDEKGNIIMREIYLNEKLIKRIIFKIVYR